MNELAPPEEVQNQEREHSKQEDVFGNLRSLQINEFTDSQLAYIHSINLVNDEGEHVQPAVGPDQNRGDKENHGHRRLPEVHGHSADAPGDVRPVVEPQNECANLARIGDVREVNKEACSSMKENHLPIVVVLGPRDVENEAVEVVAQAY